LSTPRLFAHFFDLHFLEEKGYSRSSKEVLGEMRLAIRLGILVAGEVVVPAASYYESPLCRMVLDELGRDCVGEAVSLTASTSNLDEFSEEKRDQYAPRTVQGKIYRRKRPELVFPWKRRTRGATADIAADWTAALDDGRASEAIERIAKRDAAPRDLDRRWAELPDRLGGAAFVVDNVVAPLLGDASPTYGIKSTLHGMINRAYFGSYVQDLGASVYKDLLWLEPTFPLVSGDPANDLHYRAFREFCRCRGLLPKIGACDALGLLHLRGDLDFRAAQAEYAAKEQEKAVERRLYAIAAHAESAPAFRAGGERKEIRLESSTVRPEALRVLIVNALPIEAAAALAAADEVSKPFGEAGSNIYRVCAYIGAESATPRHVLQVTLPSMGKVSAASTVAAALNAYPGIEHIIVVGIAGCCPNPGAPAEHVRLGDVVVSDQKGIIEYDFVKLEEEGPKLRRSPQVPSAHMLQAFNQLRINELRGSRPWEAILDAALAKLDATAGFARPDQSSDVLHESGAIVPHPQDLTRRPGRPRIFGGGIATADTLLKDPRVRDKLRDSYGVKAVEMEGSAIQGASWLSGKDAMVVRGTSDYADGHKADAWQPHAALVAAAYARSLIEAMPLEWFA
jgi:nucleoside phosphorylase